MAIGSRAIQDLRQEGWRKDYEPKEVDGYRIKDGGVGYVVDGDDREFMLSDFPLAFIDYQVNHKLLAMIARKLERTEGRKVRILDLGGGPTSRLSRDLLAHPLFKGKVEVTNVDPFAFGHRDRALEAIGVEYTDELKVVTEHFLDADIEPESVDLVIAADSIGFLPFNEQVGTLHKIAEILKRGGEAFIDSPSLARMCRGNTGNGMAPYMGLGQKYLEEYGLLEEYTGQVHFVGAEFDRDNPALRNVVQEHDVRLSVVSNERRLDARVIIDGVEDFYIHMGKPFYEEGFQTENPEIFCGSIAAKVYNAIPAELRRRL